MATATKRKKSVVKSEEVVLHELQFRRVKETKNTFRYEELERVGEEPVIGSLYIQKTAEPPERLVVRLVMP